MCLVKLHEISKNRESSPSPLPWSCYQVCVCMIRGDPRTKGHNYAYIPVLGDENRDWDLVFGITKSQIAIRIGIGIGTWKSVGIGSVWECECESVRIGILGLTGLRLRLTVTCWSWISIKFLFVCTKTKYKWSLALAVWWFNSISQRIKN